MLTAFGDRDSVLTALKHGAFDFIDKPYEHQKLVESVRLALEMGRAIGEVEAELGDLIKQLGKKNTAVETKRSLLIAQRVAKALVRKAG